MSDPAPLPSRKIVLALTPQQADDLRRLWREHAAPLQAMLRRWCGNDADAADALQELFLRLARTPRLALSAADSRAFLVVTARRIAIDASRRRQAGQRREDQLAASGTLTELGADARSDADLRAAIARAVRALAPEQRGVFEARIFQGLTLAEIAESQGISINTAASRFRYALDKIRAELRPYYDDMNKTQPASPVSPQSVSPAAAADQVRLIRALEPKRVPSVAPGLEGFAALAPDDASFETQPIEIVEHGIDETLLPEISNCEGMDGGLIAIDELVGEEFVGEEESDEGEVVEDGLGEEEYVGEEYTGEEYTGEEEYVGEEFVDVGFVDENSGYEWVGEIDPQIFVCWVFDGSYEPGEGGDKPEISVCWFEGIDGPEANVDDYFTIGEEDTSGETGDDTATDGEGEIGEEVYTPSAKDLFEEYQAFLSDNPDWLADNGIGGMQLQVMTSSRYVEDLQLSNPGAAKAFDLWYAANYLEASESVGEVQNDGAVDGVLPEVLYSAAGGDRGNYNGEIQPNFRNEDVAAENLAGSGDGEVIAESVAQVSDVNVPVRLESAVFSGSDRIAVEAFVPTAAPVANAGFVFTNVAFETPSSVTELSSASDGASAESADQFVPTVIGSSATDGALRQDAMEVADRSESEYGPVASDAIAFTTKGLVAQAVIVGGVGAMVAPSLLKKRVAS